MKNHHLNRQNEAKLVKDLIAHDEKAFTELVQIYHSRLARVARALVGEDDQDDVMQNAWINIYQNIQQFQHKSALGTWLTRIVINCAKTKLRKDSLLTYLHAELSHIDTSSNWYDDRGFWQVKPVPWSESPDALLEAKETLKVLVDTIDKLPHLQQLVIILHEFENWDFDAICNELEISASNVRVLLHRARKECFMMLDNLQR